jgi:hypothetical protein
MHGNDTNIIVVTDKVKVFVGKLGLVGQKTKMEEFGDVFSFEGFCGGKQCENGDTGIDQCIKDYLANLQSMFQCIFQKQ